VLPGRVVIGTVLLGMVVVGMVVVGTAEDRLDPHADSAVARASARAGTTGFHVLFWLRGRLMAAL
jgi:hypothetical protein